MHKKLLILFIAYAFLFFTFDAYAQTNKYSFITLETEYFVEMQQKSVGKVIKECNNNNICVSAAQAAATYFGVDPSKVSSAMAAVSQVAGSSDSQDKTYALRLPDGYHYCRSKIVTNSIVPFSGDRASVVGARAVSDGMDISTWTPERGAFKGSSWVHLTITILAVKTDQYQDKLNAGVCKPVNRDVDILACRGGGGVNKGMQPCGVFTH